MKRAAGKQTPGKEESSGKLETVHYVVVYRRFLLKTNEIFFGKNAFRKAAQYFTRNFSVYGIDVK